MPTNPQLRVAVIGAGVTGITTAYQLSKRGCAVTVYDHHPHAAMETSFANGGQLSASNAEVWNSWGIVFQGLKWMFTRGAPLLVNPVPTWHKLSWMAEFVAAIPRHEDNTITTTRLAIEARSHLMRMAVDESIDFDLEPRGILHIYRSKPEFEAAVRTTELLARGGLKRTAVTSAEIRHIEPAFSGDVYGGFYTEDDFSGDVHKFTHGLAAACARRDVSMNYETDVTNIVVAEAGVEVAHRSLAPRGEGSRIERTFFDRIVICGGVRSREIARRLGDRINIYPVKGYSITVNLDNHADQEAAPWTSLLDDRTKIVTSRLGRERFRVAGTAELNGFNKDIRANRIEPLVRWCRTHFPGLSTRHVVPWAGLRPMMPDMLPRVMQGKNPRIFYNTGHGHLGWTLSAATADAVSALMTARGPTTA